MKKQSKKIGTKTKKKFKFLKSIQKAAKEYDAYLEAGRENLEKFEKELSKTGGVVGKELRKTGVLVERVRRPTARFFQKASVGAQRAVRIRPLKQTTFPKLFNSRKY